MRVTEAKKGSDDYLMDWADYVIGDLVKEKQELFKAYNYYNGVRDHYQYENLEKNYGVGNPTSVSFTPLTRKHIDAIVGEYLTRKPKPRISCKDKRTLTNMFREKQLEVIKKQKEWVLKYLENAIYQAIMQQAENPQLNLKILDDLIDRELKELKDSVLRNFISNYEIAAQDICEYVLQNRTIDFSNKLELLLLDLLIAGQAYYKIVPSHAGTNFRIELCDPLNTWVDKDPKSRYMKHAYKAVVRKWMTPEEIEIKYGDYLSSEDLKKIRDWKNFYAEEGNFALVTGLSARCGHLSPGILAGVGVHPFDSEGEEFRRFDLVPVYEVEWIDSKKEEGKWIGYTYQVTRIGQDIYVLDGNDVAMPRDIDAPNEPRLSVNGIWYTNGHGSPYSLMLATADLQDKYDLNLYLKDNAIALAGTRGAIVDVAMIPEFIGDTPEERITKLLSYRKIGISLIDSAQEGLLNLNTIFNGYDDTIQPGTIQAYLLSIQIIEDLVSSITGVFRERLGGIEQRDAVANVEVGMQQSYIITKRYYLAMDTLVKEMLSDCIDMAKIVYKEGLTGQLILGDLREIISILPEYYTFTSYDISLADTAEIIKEQELMKLLAMQLTSSNQFDPEILLIVSTSKSLTEMKEAWNKCVKEKKIENNQLMQLQQQLEQAQEQQKQMQKQLEASTKKIAQLNERKLNIEQQNNQIDQEIAYAKMLSDYDLKSRELDLIEQRNKLEAAQLLDSNPNNDEVNYHRM